MDNPIFLWEKKKCTKVLFLCAKIFFKKYLKFTLNKLKRDRQNCLKTFNFIILDLLLDIIQSLHLEWW